LTWTIFWPPDPSLLAAWPAFDSRRNIAIFDGVLTARPEAAQGAQLMKVAEVMTRGVDAIDPSASVQEAATQMAELDVGAVLVGVDGMLEGVLTDRDIILRVVVDGKNPGEVAVRDVMSSRVFSCREDDPVESALVEMRERQIRRMPVLDESGRATGIVVLSDLAKAVQGPEQLQETLRQISEPHRIRNAAEEKAEAAAPGQGDDRATAA
jgi:CBS domain-containing protein